MKLVRLPLELVERPQLFARLDAWRLYKLTLLCAPAGFGKTTLVAEWINDFRSQISDFGFEGVDLVARSGERRRRLARTVEPD